MSAYPVILVAVPAEQISPKESLFAKAWSGCSQQHIPSCKGAFHDVASTTIYRGYAGPKLFAGNTSLLYPRSLGLCPLLQQVTRVAVRGATAFAKMPAGGYLVEIKSAAPTLHAETDITNNRINTGYNWRRRGSRMYPHAEFQALTRNPVEQKDAQKRIKERLTFPQCSLVSREASKSPTCGIFAHAAPQNVG